MLITVVSLQNVDLTPKVISVAVWVHPDGDPPLLTMVGYNTCPVKDSRKGGELWLYINIILLDELWKYSLSMGLIPR